MAKFKNGFGEEVVAEGIASALVDPVFAGSHERMAGDGEGQFDNNDVTEGRPGDVDAGPEAIGAKEHRVDIIPKSLQHFSTLHALSLDKELDALAFELFAELIGDITHEAIAGEKDEGFAFGQGEVVVHQLDDGAGVVGRAWAAGADDGAGGG